MDQTIRKTLLQLSRPTRPFWLARKTGCGETNFYMTGDLGDIIYALPTIRALGGGNLHLGPSREHPYYHTREPMTFARFQAIAPLLNYQKDYLWHSMFSETFKGWDTHVDLGDGRRMYQAPYFDPTRNLVDAMSSFFDCGESLWKTKWLTVQPNKVAKFVFSRSPRYHNSLFPWKRLVEKLGAQAVFVGTKEEHEAFELAAGPVAHHKTANLLEVAEVIDGAAFFVGNQSCPLSIAEGLHKTVFVEEYAPVPNCRFPRFGHTTNAEALLC